MTRREKFDKKQQKLERMEKIARDAVRLKDAIKSEVDAIMEEIDAEINSPKKAKPFFWDGKQPHYWRENGKMFRKAMKYDIGKTVIVCNWDDPNPLSNIENRALLEGITQFDDFTVRSTNGSRLCHFPLAWVDCHPFDSSFDDVPHICVFMGNALAKVADKPEQADPLIDEESFLKPESGTVDCNHHVCELAKPTGLTCPPDSCDIDDGVRELPAADHIADANKKVPPNGYRLLGKSAKSEPRKAGDLFWSRTARKWMELVDDSVEYANRDDWPACRKIETENNSETPNSSLPDPGEGYRLLSKDPPEPVFNGIQFWDTSTKQWHDCKKVEGLQSQAPSYYYRRKIEQAKAPEPEYREPTQADLANGPIDVEVCDDTDCDTNWEKRQLYAILPIKCMFPYIVGTPGLEQFTQCWKHARIKVEG